MSLAIAETFWIGVVATAFAFVAAIFMRELPLRRTLGAAAPATDDDDSAARAKRRSALPVTD